MSRSGVGLHKDCVPAFDELKLGKKLKFIIYKLSDDKTTIEVAERSENATYEDFLAMLPENDCRYAVYDFEYDTSEGKRSKICFFTWSPDNAPVRAKMIYSSSKDGLRRALNGVAAEIQGTDFSEVAFETVRERFNKGGANN